MRDLRGGGNCCKSNQERRVCNPRFACVCPIAGTGTFSRVRIARHKASGKYTALKILKKVRRTPSLLALVFAPLAGELSLGR